MIGGVVAISASFQARRYFNCRCRMEAETLLDSQASAQLRHKCDRMLCEVMQRHRCTLQSSDSLSLGCSLTPARLALSTVH